MSSPKPHLSFGDVFRDPHIRRLWFAQVVSVFGDFLALLGVISVVTFQLHGTATEVGMILVAYLLPIAIFSPLAGVMVDRWDVKSTIIASDLIRGLLVMGLLFVHNLNVIYGIFFLISVLSSLFLPAQAIAVRTLTPPAGLLSVNALMQQAVQGSQILAPFVMGLLVDWFGANACFLLDGLSFFFSAAMVMTLAIHPVRSGAARAASTVMDSMREGFGFIFTHSAISFVIVSMTAGMFGLRCFGALLSVYVRDILMSKTALFGMLSTLIGVGMIAGTQSLTRFARKASKEYLVISGLAGMGVAVLITAVFGTIATTALGMLTLGFSAAFVMTPAQTLLQQETPHELLGRVTSSLMSLLCISQVLALFVAGPVASRLGIRNLYFGSAAMLLAIGAVGLARLRAVREEPARVAAD